MAHVPGTLYRRAEIKGVSNRPIKRFRAYLHFSRVYSYFIMLDDKIHLILVPFFIFGIKNKFAAL